MSSSTLWKNRCESAGPYLRMKTALAWGKWLVQNIVQKNSVLWLKLIGDAKNTGCSSKMIFNALKWGAKPVRGGRKWNTTIKMDRRITRTAQAQPMTSTRMIKDSLEIPVSTVRRLREANLFSRIPRKVPLLKKGMCRRAYDFWQSTAPISNLLAM